MSNGRQWAKLIGWPLAATGVLVWAVSSVPYPPGPAYYAPAYQAPLTQCERDTAEAFDMVEAGVTTWAAVSLPSCEGTP